MDPKVQRRIEQLAKLHGGRLTPRLVVDDARDPKSPLHSAFPWDDAQAAEAYRLNLARALIRSVRIERVVNERTVTSVRFVRDPEQSARKRQGYIDVLRLKDDRGRARQALESELASALTRFQRAIDLARQLDLEDRLDRLIDEVEQLLFDVRAAA